MAKRKSKRVQIEELAVAAVNALLEADIPTFPKAAVYVCVMSGRTEEATKMINDWKDNHIKPEL